MREHLSGQATFDFTPVGQKTVDRVDALERIVDALPARILHAVEADLTERAGYWACAIPLLGALRDRQALDLLIRVANQEAEHLAGMDHMAIGAVAAMADWRELGFLEGKSHIWAVRPAVFEALARIAAPGSAPILATGLLDGEDPRTVAAAETGLQAIGAPARDVLLDMLATYDGDRVFRDRVEALLGRIP